jgi:vancomycin resistance protein YoaR
VASRPTSSPGSSETGSEKGSGTVSRRDDARVPLGGVVAGCTVLGLALLLGAGWVALYLYAGDRAPRSARVEGVDISHLAPGAAEEKLRGVLEARAHQPIQVSYGDGRTSAVDPASAGLAIDYPASVTAAGGGSGWSLDRLWEVASGGGDHRAVVTVDEQKMQTALDALAQGIGTPPVDGTVVFRGGRAVGVPGRPGLVMDRSEARAMLVQRFLHQGSQKLPTTVSAPVVTADEVNRVVGAFGEPAMSGPVTVVVAGHRVVAAPTLFGRALSMRVQDGHLVPQVDGDVLMQALTPLMPTVASQPVDASVVLRDGRPVVVPSRVGLTADTSRLESGFAAALTRRGSARRVVVPAQVRQPGFGTAAAQALGVRQKVSTSTARFAYADYRNTNLTRAAAKVDGTLLQPGDSFSLNGIVGAVTPHNGFAEASGVADGVSGREAGGGISALATAAYDAMFFAGLQDGTHTAPQAHAAGSPVGLDATVAWPSADLQFVNDSRHGVLVSASVRRATPGHPGAVTVSMWSTRQWDVTALTGPLTGVRQPAVRYVQAGTCEPVVGSPGFGVDVVRVFRKPGSSTVVRKETFHTDYRAADTVRCGRPKRSTQS